MILTDHHMSKLRKQLKSRKEKDVSTNSKIDLAEGILKSNIFKFKKKTTKQNWGIYIGTKFASPYSVLFSVILEKKITKESEYKTCWWWNYINGIFFVWEDDEYTVTFH